MYSTDRDEASKILNMSTRTIDRYIRSGKLRSQKKGKKVYLNDQDIQILKNGGIQEDYEIITEKQMLRDESQFTTKAIDGTKNFKNLYEDSLQMIEKKDELIKDLSYRLGKAEVELKNSIPMLEYKKTTFLLESSNNRAEDEKKEMTKEVEDMKEKVRTQELLNLILVIIFSIMLVVVFLVWFANV